MFIKDKTGFQMPVADTHVTGEKHLRSDVVVEDGYL